MECIDNTETVHSIWNVLTTLKECTLYGMHWQHWRSALYMERIGIVLHSLRFEPKSAHIELGQSEHVLCTHDWQSALYMIMDALVTLTTLRVHYMDAFKLYCTLHFEPKSAHVLCTREFTRTMHTSLTECTLYGMYWPQWQHWKSALYMECIRIALSMLSPRVHTRSVHERAHFTRTLHKKQCIGHIEQNILYCTLDPRVHTRFVYKRGHTSPRNLNMYCAHITDSYMEYTLCTLNQRVHTYCAQERAHFTRTWTRNLNM